MTTLRKSMWLMGIGIFIFASMYGSWLVSKERDKAFQTTKDNNQLLKLINDQVTSNQGMLDRQSKALENHEKIIQAANKSIDQNIQILKNQEQIVKNIESVINENRKILVNHSDVLKSQDHILDEVQKTAKANRQFIEEHTKQFQQLLDRLQKLLPVKPAIKSARIRTS